MPRSRGRPFLPHPEKLRETAEYFLRQGPEEEEAELLSACVLELSEPRPFDGDYHIVSIGLRAKRKVLERLLMIDQPDDPPPPILKRIRSALTLALPPGLVLGRLDVRAAGPGQAPGPKTHDPKEPASNEIPPAEREVLVAAVRNAFEKVGAQWRVVFDGGQEFHLPDHLGAKYLDYLLHHPGETISGYDLEVKINPRKEEARVPNSIQPQNDPQAVKAYLDELEKLRPQYEAAKDARRAVEADRLAHDIKELEKALAESNGTTDTGERARNNVRQAVRAVRNRLRAGTKSEKAFKEHIEQFVSLSYKCVYTSPFVTTWG